MTEKLKSCPFCGGAARAEQGGTKAWVECTGPSCDVHQMHDTIEQAVITWNIRVDQQEPTLMTSDVDRLIEPVARAIASAEWQRDARLRRPERDVGDTAERCAERSWGLWVDHARAALHAIAQGDAS